ncbi:malonic semialdehyde reductase [Micromonospora endophytica]|uniref:Malonic semialdehyde reductase n=1 Tax=Micromonospora endophytica TaxID=515350 RepID=A0A2W2CL16_9ACTN|nr:malonic semialdehyde reductase [Micromonospora endophytica]PZF88797.1 malonic semialdehyde reductase [Micromonospora endophytica]RIW41274.1 malonic semialdehyde reductase [Micromonospora endophytica]BCJ57618.1 nitroreductase family protein [Micromonospora endophytica]
MTAANLRDDLLTLDQAGQDLLFRAARTANTFTDEPVTDEQIAAIHDLMRYGPTAYNGQPLRLLLVRSPQARDRLLPYLSSSNRAKTAVAPLVVVAAADLDYHERLPELYPHRPQARDWLAADEDARAAQARFNAALQIGYLLVGIRAAGLAAGPMAGFDPAGVTREFFPDGRHEALLVINIGRPGPQAWQDRLPRLGTDDVLRTI